MSVTTFSGRDDDVHAIIARTAAILRMLRNSLRALGFDQVIAEVAGTIPDARARLGYVVTLTTEAATGVLNSVELSQPCQARLEEEAGRLASRWNGWFSLPGGNTQALALATDTRSWLASVPLITGITRQQLHTIMMAQGFQDLTGQVVQRMMWVLDEVEQQLVQVLRDSAPISTERCPAPLSPALAGGRPASQDDVDDLLASLGL